MKIGTVKLPGKLALAPMAGVTDRAFRVICRELGADYTVTEMVSAKALCYQDKKTIPLMALDPGDAGGGAAVRQRPCLHGRGGGKGGRAGRSRRH